MAFSLGSDRFYITRHQEQDAAAAASSSSAPSTSSAPAPSGRNGGVQNCLAEREHMFDKVVTPSDVGKLNRLVIPKQHAERYFPLDSAANEKGLLLSFEDRGGKSWRFRYSYWNSSQSYVMTKGWSRFVKEKRLDAGDTVSFSRGVGEASRGRLYIDWKRRPDVHDPARVPRIPIPGFSFGRPPPVGPWASHNYLGLPQAVAATTAAAYGLHRQGQIIVFQSPVLGPSSAVEHGGGSVSEIIESMPAVQSQTAAKRVRLFGVNLLCNESEGNVEGSTTEGASLGLLRTQPACAPTLQSRQESSSSMSKEQDSSLDLDL